MTRVLIDFSNIAHVCWSRTVTSPGLAIYGPDEIFTSHLAGKIRSIQKAILNHGHRELEFIFVKDQSSQRKLQLFPKYKSNRNHAGIIDIQFEIGERFLKHEGFGKFCYSPANEADDAIATLCKENNAIIVSNDKDFWQLLEHDRIWVINPISKEFTTVSHIRKAFRLDLPIHIPLHKTLWGDAGDAIPNVIPRMQKRLLPILKETDGTLEHFLRCVRRKWSELPDRCKDLLKEGQEQLEINYQLVLLDKNCYIVWE